MGSSAEACCPYQHPSSPQSRSFSTCVPGTCGGIIRQGAAAVVALLMVVSGTSPAVDILQAIGQLVSDVWAPS